jgi:hypothetical protein
MAVKRIVCVQNRAENGGGHRHIATVGVSFGGAVPVSYETVDAVRANLLDNNDTYYTWSPSHDTVSLVDVVSCACGAHTIRSKPDAVADNDLDRMEECP